MHFLNNFVFYLGLNLCIYSLSFSQQANLDYKWHNVGNVLQLITNVGFTSVASSAMIVFMSWWKMFRRPPKRP